MSELPRARGARPVFLDTAVADDLLAMVMALTQEVAVLRERCDTTERLLVKHGVFAPDAIETFAPDRTADREREEWRRDYLDRILFVVNARADEKAFGETAASYEETVEEIGATAEA